MSTTKKKGLLSICITLLLFLVSCSGYRLTSDAQTIYDNILSESQDDFLLMKGTDFQTPYFIYDSGNKGESVLILGGTHGDEPAGYETTLRLVQLFESKPPLKGKIILVPLANKKAVQNYNRRIPVPAGVDIEKGNLNRCYPGVQDGYPMQQMAWQIQQLAEEHKISVFIDIHEARYLHLNTPKESYREKGLGQTVIYYPNEASSWLVMNMLDKINETIDKPDEHFSAIEEPIYNSAAWWAGSKLDIAAFTFETARILPLEKRIQYHTKLVEIVLKTTENW